jgi:ArsR family transcriptional regulator, arsenate/arsenite/antimonite-responsive transcriptional repressor
MTGKGRAAAGDATAAVVDATTAGPAAAGPAFVAPRARRSLVERGCELNSAISDTTRMKMIKVLASNPEHSVSVSDVARILGISQPAATKQLRVLHSAGLVRYKRIGRAVYYSVDEETVAEYHRIIEYAFAHAHTPCVNGYDCDTCPYRETCV